MALKTSNKNRKKEQQVFEQKVAEIESKGLTVAQLKTTLIWIGVGLLAIAFVTII